MRDAAIVSIAGAPTDTAFNTLEVHTPVKAERVLVTVSDSEVEVAVAEMLEISGENCNANA